jgi:hypothetical protein
MMMIKMTGEEDFDAEKNQPNVIIQCSYCTWNLRETCTLESQVLRFSKVGFNLPFLLHFGGKVFCQKTLSRQKKILHSIITYLSWSVTSSSIGNKFCVQYLHIICV